jgi:hypothetical protein
MSRRVPTALIVSIVLLLSASVRAGIFIPAADNKGQAQGAIGDTTNLTIGYNFTVGATAITIDALGLDYGTGNLLHGTFPPVPVHIWEAGTTTNLALALIDDANLLSTPVNYGGGAFGVAYYYTAITPVTLAANTTYVIGADLQTSTQGAVFAGPTVNDPRLSLGAPVSGPSSFPTGNVIGAPEYFGPSFQIAAVPEPATGGFGMIALAGLCLRRYRNSRSSQLAG